MQTLGRVRRVDRYITGTGLENGDQPDQRIEATAGDDGDAIIGFHTQCDQMMSQGISMPVEFGIAQLLTQELCCHSFWPLRHLGLETLGNGQRRGEIGVTGIERQQNLFALGRWQNRQLVERGVRRLLQRQHQTFQGAVQVIADALWIDLGGGQQGQAEGIAEIVDAQGQRIVGAFFGADRADAFPGRQGLGTRRRRVVAVAVIEQGTEQRRRRDHAAATLGECQWCVFVAHQRGQAFVRRLHRRTHALCIDIDPQRQGVDENPQRPLGGFGALHTAHQHRTEHYVLFAGEHRQYLRPAQMKQARDTHAELPRLCAQTLAEQRIDRQAQLSDTEAVALHILQTVGQRRLGYVSEHVAEKNLVLSFADAQPRLRHVIAKRHRPAERLSLASEAGEQFVTHHVERRVVQRHVMEQQRRDHALTALIPRVGQTHHRRAPDVQTEMPRIETLVQLLQRITCAVCQHDLFHRQRCLTPDHLQRHVQPFPMHRRAQDVVAIDDLLQGLSEVLQTLAAAERKVRLHDVRIALLVARVVIENAFLQRCQWVDVLHIGGAAWYLGEQAVEGRLIHVNQGHHRWGDVRGAGENAVGRNVNLADAGGRVLAGLDQFDQRRFVLAQRGQQRRIAQRLFVAVDAQLLIGHRQLNVFCLQGCQQFEHIHRTISILSVIAA
ncbi:hypothetical protein D3C87_508110 [compost metagenome]